MKKLYLPIIPALKLYQGISAISTKIKLSVLLLFFFSFGYAQNSGKEEYLLARVERGFLNSNFHLFTDYNTRKGKDTYEIVRDSSERKIEFETTSAALSYLGKKGWNIVSVIPDLPPRILYLFKRNIL
jgi:hypothetical protein